MIYLTFRSQMVAGVAQPLKGLGYRLDGQGSILSRVREGFFSVRYRIQTGSGAYPLSYPMGTGSTFPRSKATGAWRWPFTYIMCWG